ncbi:MAG: exodeoxyribonuclease VII large subunit, partial [Methylocella sp.]
MFFNPLLQGMWIGGEVTDLTIHPSGHIYFTLRDKEAVIRAVYFGGVQKSGAHPPEEGMRIEAYGRVDIYARRGMYQLYVEQLTKPKEKGDLAEEFVKIKAQLEKEGLLTRPRKPLPVVPQRIGVVTSPQAAALRDVLRVGWKRHPGAQFLLAPAVVQGPETAPSVIHALDLLNWHRGCDVIILTRGGGSLEELWGFNDIGVAHAIAESKVPVVTGIGHEVDTTIADLVADAVAPTPSAAAERVVPDAADFETGLRQVHSRIARGLAHRLKLSASQLKAVSQRRIFRAPG